MANTSDHFVPSYRTCDGVSERCPVKATTYGYFPDLGANTFFAVFFGILFLVSLSIGIKRKTWSYTAFLGVGTLLECLGYVGRILMHSNPWSNSAFELQICCLVLAPSFVAGSLYLTLKHLVLYCGPQHSRLQARLYPWVFVGCDLGSIVLQACGGGIAAGAGHSGSRKLLNAGNGLIVAGIAFQVFTMSVCGSLALDFLLRSKRAHSSGGNAAVEKTEQPQYEKDREDVSKHRRFTLFCVAMGFAYIAVLIRCIYRIPEMAGGWGNALMQNEREFLLLDGMMIAFAVFAMTALHPGIFFTPMRKFATNTPTT